MKYAIVDNVRVEAQKGLNGLCPICHEPLVPRCGSKKINHWAHKKSTHCDKWWESETEWHRGWKNLFPEEWQEVVFPNSITEEKHIADIFTPYGMVVEFQYSNISETERKSRECFYKKMLWVVNGTRRKLDFKRFVNAVKDRELKKINETPALYILSFPEWHLPKDWLNSSQPVLFDLKENKNDIHDHMREPLWCLLPIHIHNNIRLLYEYDRNKFVYMVSNRYFEFDYTNIINKLRYRL